MTQPKDVFSITAGEVEHVRLILNTIIKDLSDRFPAMRKDTSQKGHSAALAQPLTPAVLPLVASTGPLNTVNLRHHQHQQNRVHQRSPATPTSTQPPFLIAASSPQGTPTYIGKPAITQETLYIPARTKKTQNSSKDDGENEQHRSSEYDHYQTLSSPHRTFLRKRIRKPLTDSGQLMDLDDDDDDNDTRYTRTSAISQTAFADKNHLVPFERSFAVLEFGEPIDDFTEEESELFEKAYLETPKQWDKIAESLPRRDYKACIQHYYVMKRSTQLKEKVKKQKKKTRRVAAPKGAKPKSNALIADIVNRDEGEDRADSENGGERRRPRRAAALTFAFKATLETVKRRAQLLHQEESQLQHRKATPMETSQVCRRRESYVRRVRNKQRIASSWL
jgi:hypothetical protein